MVINVFFFTQFHTEENVFSPTFHTGKKNYLWNKKKFCFVLRSTRIRNIFFIGQFFFPVWIGVKTPNIFLWRNIIFIIFLFYYLFIFFNFVPQVKETILYECFFPTLFHTGKMFFIHLASHTKKLIFFHTEFFFFFLCGIERKKWEKYGTGWIFFFLCETFSLSGKQTFTMFPSEKKKFLVIFFFVMFFLKKKKYLFSCVERSGMTQISQGFFIYFFSACVEWWEYFIGDKN